MDILNKAKTGKKERPIKVVQFGEGNFLRGFVDYMIDIANEQGKFDGDIVLIKPIEFGNLDMFHKQDCQYTVSLRGNVNGEAKIINRIVTSVADAVDTYNKKNGKDTVSFKKLSTKDNKATLTLEYDSATDYQKFNDITLFTGSVAEALAAGYSFDTDFASVSDKEIKACDKNEFLNDASYKVVVIQANTNVSVKGTIAYVSVQNTNYIDSKTIAIREGTSIFNNGKENNTEATETQEGTETVAETENTEQAVSEDDLLNATTEETEKVFDFSEDTAENKTDSEFSQVYTYIIYK